MVRIAFLFSLLLFSAFSCSKEDEAPVDPLDKYPAYITRVDAPETAVLGTNVPVTVYFSVNNSCGEFREFKVEKKSDATYVEVYPKYRDGACLMYLPIREVVYNFKPTAPGTYTFRFSPVYPDGVITKTIVVSDVASIGQ